MRTLLFSAALAVAAVSNSAWAQTPIAKPISDWFDTQGQDLFGIYCNLHQNPELSWDESATADLMADHWRREGFDVTAQVGIKGVVGILRNGDGPTLMLRCDMDALPVTELTQLDYASTKDVSLPSGVSAGVMHACGHDIHMTNMIAVAKYMATHRQDWSGTLMVIAQPAEEKGEGARAMIDDGLFTNFPKPDFAVALHVSGDTPAGQVGVLAGFTQANVDSVDIDVKGRGGHGAAPETTIDPIVQAADLVMSLQTIASREIKPSAPVVITVGAIAGGTKHNIIGDSCHLQLTVRTYGDEVRKQVLAAITRKANAVAESYGAPSPELLFSQGTPSLENNAELAGRLREVFKDAIGEQNVLVSEPSMGGEDFSRYGREGVPILMYKLGSVTQSRLDRFAELEVPPPSLHSGHYYPDFEPTMRTAVVTMTAAALHLLKK
ncbi:M20 metallopeptidase family protein [Rubripirellula reticaptiva]|uniref:Putative hydrolase YxeP n=1 Tax=Rubripirellula reticaptiva TaxID=2528013 RepID=A0A5C6EJ06_9BACT|nr:amidohydrolase [Rubripirellula reticaptiva]TWU49733.1 putative hydrolase YxeP [Rubripirellula reticaptiva]